GTGSRYHPGVPWRRDADRNRVAAAAQPTGLTRRRRGRRLELVCAAVVDKARAIARIRDAEIVDTRVAVDVDGRLVRRAGVGGVDPGRRGGEMEVTCWGIRPLRVRLDAVRFLTARGLERRQAGVRGLVPVVQVAGGSQVDDVVVGGRGRRRGVVDA